MRPIDADKLIRQLCLVSPDCDEFGRGVATGISTAIQKTADTPTLTLDDLRPKGRWVEKPWTVLGITLGVDIVCSECGEDAPTFTDGGSCTVLTKFCHNCGAMMGNGE